MLSGTKCWWRGAPSERSPGSWDWPESPFAVSRAGGSGSEAEAPRPRPVWDAVAERVQAVLTDSVRWTGGKQRLTATRLHELLLVEGRRAGAPAPPSSRDH
jgi:hypothetical protein